MKKNQLKSTKGITLIALVITVIVLIILLGVSLAKLYGENGIITQVEDAKAKTERAEVIEKAQTDIAGVQAGNKGKIREAELQEILKKYDKDGQVRKNDKGESYIIITNKEEQEQEIKATEIYNGKLELGEFNPEELTIGAAINTDKYGWKVKEYTVKTTDCPSGVWRLFYQDGKYTYLINDEVTATKYKPSDYYDTIKDGNGDLKYQTGADVSTVGQKLSSKISYLFKETNITPIIRYTAWITDPEEWKDYKDEKGDAVFAIGSPTVELFTASYNNTGKSKKIILQAGTYGYSENTGRNWFNVSDNYGIYNKDGSSSWYIASPYNMDYINISYAVNLGAYGGCFSSGDGVDYASSACRPIVCIPTHIFNSDYLDSVVAE